MLKPTAVVAIAVAVPAGLVGVAAALVVGVIGAPVWVTAAAAVAAAAIVAVWLRFTASGAALRVIGSRPAVQGDSPRLNNLVEGLCMTHGFHKPRLHIVDTDAINCACVGMRRQRGHLVVTSGALNQLDRLELEAVLTRQLCELRRGVESTTALAAVSRLPGARLAARQVWQRVHDSQHAVDVDIESVRLTCYPPALAGALQKAAQAPKLNGRSSATPVWLAPPDATAGSEHPRQSLVQRIDVLGEV